MEGNKEKMYFKIKKPNENSYTYVNVKIPVASVFIVTLP